MLSELGHFALILAFFFAISQATLPIYAITKKKYHLFKLIKPIVLGQFIFCLLSYIILSYAFVNHDFSLLYVANNSAIELPFIYKIPAVWGSHEGSMLLWVLILSLWTVFVLFLSNNLEEKIRIKVIAILGFISIGFLLFLLAASNPFLRTFPNVPLNGNDLNPLLQDFGMLLHPPLLYIGYVGFVVPFAIAIACLLAGKIDATWAKWSRPWALVAWFFLTLGIALGSWWAYRVLGWGGWWFWDPVENASFMPWLVGTALIHSLIVTEKRNAFRAWTVFLAISAFALSLLGAFLVRSGILTSVHAFAVDPTRGLYLLIFFLVVVGFSFILYAWRGQKLSNYNNFSFLSRESMLMLNNVFLAVIMATILLGTLYPLFIDALGLGKLSVGAPYFNMVFIPLLIPILILMGLGPYCYWQKISIKLLFHKIKYILAFCIILALIIFLIQKSWQITLGLTLAFWIITTTINQIYTKKNKNLSFWGMVLAHIGVAITLIGVTLTTNQSLERDVRMSLNESVTLGKYNFKFMNLQDLQGSNYEGIRATFTVSKNNQEIYKLNADKKFYPKREFAVTESAITANIWRDIYIALGNPIKGSNDWSVRLYVKPFIRWIWFGAILMALGAILSIFFHAKSKKSKL